MLLENMNRTADPCEDFYQFVCGGFEERVVIPDDRLGHSRTQQKVNIPCVSGPADPNLLLLETS